ncbi:MAG: DUF1572 family protein [Lewinella sp.]|nr:DUF1572 family protein [Lewinella sp.]
MERSVFAEEFVAQAIFRMEEFTPRIRQCLAELSEEQIWLRPNRHSNSVGNLVLHLCGNIGQYILSSLAGRPDSRERDAEFAARGGLSGPELARRLSTTVDQAVAVIGACPEAELLRKRDVQGFQLSGIGIIVHVVEHYSYHTGQIAFWTKALRDMDLGFYADLDLNIQNPD